MLYSNTYDGFTVVAFQFSRIGNDPDGAQMLVELDEDPHIGEHIDVLRIGFDLERQFIDKWFMVRQSLPSPSSWVPNRSPTNPIFVGE